MTVLTFAGLLMVEDEDNQMLMLARECRTEPNTSMGSWERDRQEPECGVAGEPSLG